MRMWMVPPVFMCKKHLSGEHVEHHMFIGSFKKKIRMDGYIRNDLLEIKSMIDRHDAIVRELSRRAEIEGKKYNHRTPMPEEEEIKRLVSYLPKPTIHHKIDGWNSFKELITRCEQCHKRLFYITQYQGAHDDLTN